MALMRRIAIVALLFLVAGTASTRYLAGSWLEHEIGLVVTLQQQPNGYITGSLQGAGAPMALDNLR